MAAGEPRCAPAGPAWLPCLFPRPTIGDSRQNGHIVPRASTERRRASRFRLISTASPTRMK